MSPKPFAERSGVVGRFTIDPKSEASVSKALSELLKLYQGDDYAEGRVGFSVDSEDAQGMYIAPIYQFLSENSEQRHRVMMETNGF